MQILNDALQVFTCFSIRLNGKRSKQTKSLMKGRTEFIKHPSGLLFLQTETRLSTHRYFFLRYDNCTVLSPDGDRREPTLVYGLESIF